MLAAAERLRKIKRFDQLMAYLRDELDWPVEDFEFDELTYDWEPDELERREARQAPVGEKRNRARLTIRNDGTLEDLAGRAKALWREILSEGLPEPSA